jgi:ribosome-interacting GTPase 1
LLEIVCEMLDEDWSCLMVSAKSGRNLEELRWAIYKALNIIRVYSKPPGEEPDLSAPFVLEEGATVEEFAGKIHRDFFQSLKSARIWGTGVFDGQMVGRDHQLHDGDIVELRV